jgi:hypothetical protein
MELCQDCCRPTCGSCAASWILQISPLNVAPATQEDRHIAQIKKWLTRKVLDSFDEMQRKEPEEYPSSCGKISVAFSKRARRWILKARKLLGLFLLSLRRPEKLTTPRNMCHG